MLIRLSRIFRFFIILALTLLLVSCDFPLTQASKVAAELPQPPAGAWIDAPLTGAQAPPGTPIKVIGHVDPSVGHAILYLNGINSGLPAAPILNKKPPAYQWEWIPQQPGIYDLRVGGAGGPLSSVVRVTILGDMPFNAEFWADQTTLKLGECTSLHWTTENALHVQLDGSEVDPQGNLGICPQQDETHVLQVQYKDNTSEELILQITVIIDTPTPTITDTPTPTNTFTPTPTSTQTKYVPPVITTAVPPVVPPVATTTVPPPSDTNPPPAPTGLTPCGGLRKPAPVSSMPVYLSWSPVQDESGITKYEIILTNLKTQQITRVDSQGTRRGVTVEVGDHSWQVRALDGAGNWGQPSVVCYIRYTTIY